MRTKGCVVVGFALLLGAAGPSKADDQGDCQALIAKAVKAAGGEENLAKYKAMTWKEKGTFYGMGAGIPYTGTYAVQWPGQFRMEIEGVFTIVLDGDKGWVKDQGGTKEMTKEQLAEQKESQYAGWVSTLLPLKDKSYQLAPLGESKVADRAAVGVKVSSKGHRDVNLYFDKESGILVKSDRRAKDEMSGQEVNQEAYYADYKEVAGLKLPMKITIKRDSKQFVEAENLDLKPVEKLDASVFAKP
jgi:hypothetical protein